MQKPHIHAELIKAWADGAKIEYFDGASGKWRHTDQPLWYVDFNYRIKPEPKSLGQVAFEAYFKSVDKFVDQQQIDDGWKDGTDKWRAGWEAAAQAAVKVAKERE